MIQSIDIQNFRCFRQTKASSFGLVNVFGGANNAGKTALLEAIYFLGNPDSKGIRFTNEIIRRENVKIIQEDPAIAWGNFFYNLDKKREITIIGISVSKEEYKILISCDESIDEFVQLLNDKMEKDIGIVEFAKKLIDNQESKKSTLHIQSFFNNVQMNTGVMIASSEGKGGRFTKKEKLPDIELLPAFLPFSSRDIAKKYSEIALEGGRDFLLSALKAIDESISHIEVLAIGEPSLYVKRKKEELMPLTLFGDAMHRIAKIVLEIVTHKDGIILIDEIENGIHYTNQAKVWKMLFDLATEFNVQIFATSHSREMIEAFTDTVQEYGLENKGSYFEMSRHYKTNDIVVNKISIDTLEYKLENDKPFRGE